MFRLLMIFAAQFDLDNSARCFRNTRLNGQPISIDIPTGLPGAWVPPRHGKLEFDFVSMERAPPMCITAGNEAVRALIHLVRCKSAVSIESAERR